MFVRTRGSPNIAPMLARTACGWKASAPSPTRKKPEAPAAKAVRMSVPRFPGVRICPTAIQHARSPTGTCSRPTIFWRRIAPTPEARGAPDRHRNCSGVIRQYGVSARLSLRTHLRATGAMSNRSLYTMVCTDQPWSRAAMKLRMPSTNRHPDDSRIRLSAINERIREKVGPGSSDRRSFVSSAAILPWPGRPAQISGDDVFHTELQQGAAICATGVWEA